MKSYRRFTYAMWGVVAIILWLQYFMDTSVVEALLISISIVALSYPLTTYLSTTLLQKAIRRKQMRRFALQFLLFSVVGGVALFSVLFLFSKLEMVGLFKQSQFLSVKFYDKPFFYDVATSAFLTTLLLNFGFCGIRFYQENLKLQEILIDSKMKVLKNQLNPHFMFNVLNHLHYYIEQKDDIASDLLLKYSDILRYQLYSGEKEYVSLREEIEFLENFIKVESMRWQDKLDIEYSWEVEESSIQLSPLLLITLVENAFKHVSRVGDSRGFISIKLWQQGSKVVLWVENSVTESKTESEQGFGLPNLRNRLETFYYDRHLLELEENNERYSAKLTLEL